MENEKYIPHPINTSDIALPDELVELSEHLAKNVHEVWSKSRIDQGWTYGPVRDDDKLQHPCIVPYEQLSESEKVLDRNTSQETLKLILKLGFKITKE